MATLAEIQAKQKELLTSNPKATFIDARNALKQTAQPQATETPSPVGQPPAPTPATPTAPTQGSFNEQTQGMNVAERQAVRQAPVTPAPIPEAITTPTTPVTPETPTPTTPVDKTAEIKAKNEAQMALNKQKAQERQAERDAQMTQANNQLANDENGILNLLKTGGIIPEVVKTSPNYKTALNTYNKLQQYGSYSVGQLTTALDNGAILPGTSLYNEMMKDPAMKTKLTEAQIFTTGKATQPQYETVTQEIVSSNPTTASFLADGVITQDEWDTATNSAEVIAKAKDVEEKTNKYNELMAEYEAVEDEVKAQFPASPFADSIIADRQKAKWKNVILAKGEMDTANGTLTELKNKAASLFETNLALYQKQQDIANQYKMAQFQAQLGLQTKGAEMQMEADFAKQQAELAQNDPYTAISNVMATYAEMGIPFTESIQTKVANAEQFIAQGGTLAGYLDKMIKDIQDKPLYKSMVDAQMRQLAPDTTTTTPEWKQDASGNWYNAKSTISPAEQIATSSTYLNIPRTGNNVGQDTNNPGNIMGDTEAQRNIALGYGAIGFYKSPNGRTYAVFPDMQSGVNASMADLQAKLSGGSSWATPNTTLEKFASGWVSGPNAPINQSAVSNYVKLTGYPKNTPISQIPIDVLAKAVFANEGVDISKSANLAGLQGTGATGTQVSKEAQAWVNAWNNGTMDIETILTKIGSSKEAMPLKNEVIQAIDAQGGVAWRKDDDPMVLKMDDLISKLDSSSKSKYLNTISGTVQRSLSNFITGGKSDLLSDLKTVIEGGTLQSLIDAKAQGATFGALSNEELKMLQATSSSIAANAIRDPDTKEIIGFRMSEKKLKSELEKMKKLFEEKKSRMTGAGIRSTQPQQTAPAPQQTNTGAGQANTGVTYSYNGQAITLNGGY